MTIGANPAHIEELRIGGGYDNVDGGADHEQDGTIRTRGDVIIDGASLSVAGSPGEHAELVTNGDFEGPYSDGVAAGWAESDTGDVLTLSEETTDVYAGSSCQKYTRTSATPANIYLYQSGIALSAGTVYRLSFAAKVLAGAIGKIHLLGSTNGSQNLLTEDITDATWTQYTFDFVLSSDFAGTVSLRIGTAFNSVATFLIDALSLKALDGGGVRLGGHTAIIGNLEVEGDLGNAENPNLLKLHGDGVDVRGDMTVQGGAVDAGVSGTTRGVIAAWHGGSNAPGCVKLVSENGTPYFLFVEDDGTLRIHSSAPTSNADGVIAGTQF